MEPLFLERCKVRHYEPRYLLTKIRLKRNGIVKRQWYIGYRCGGKSKRSKLYQRWIGRGCFSYQDSSSGTWDIRTQRLTNTGLIAWGNGIDVGVAAGQQTNNKSIWDGLYGTIYAFEDRRSGTGDIYAYKVDSNGISVGFNNAIINESGICVYPNPSNGEINFDLTNKNTFEIANLTVLDAFGKEVLSHIITSDSIYVLKNKLYPGIYFFTILNKNIFIRGKFVAQN